MKILSAQQTRQADAFTITNEPISSIDLMERAARQLYYWFHENLRHKPEIWIFCGKGNNGGDGLALSRMLLMTGWKVKTLIIEHSLNESKDFKVNLKRLKSIKSDIVRINASDAIFSPTQEVVLVDAILGSGLNSPLKGLILDIVIKINALKNNVIAVDIPTGLFADDNTNNTLEDVLKCDYTLTFQAPKYSFLFPNTGALVGDFEVLDINLHSDYLEDVESKKHLLTENDVLEIFKSKCKFDHKGTNGHAILIGGSSGKMGAITFAAKSCLKSGAGLVTMQVPKTGLMHAQVLAPEIMATHILGHSIIEKIEVEEMNTFGIGPGMGTDEKTQKAILNALNEISKPIVMDADALNIVSLNNAWERVPSQSILTPHIGELSRMVGKKVQGEEALTHAKNFAKKHNAIVVVKGAHTAIVLPNQNVYFNNTGNPGMATAGSGDVLSGMITSFLTQGYSPVEATKLGVFVHGLAGDFAAYEMGLSGLNAQDIIENIPYALKWFE